MNYKKINTYAGWLVFLIATIVYFITIEDTVSLWDCGEYITAAYKLEVGHPPGAPLFMVIGRLFTFFADPESVAIWINRLSALSSSLTILFMFWSITMFVKKMVLKSRTELSKADQIAIFASATIGSLAYTFSDSFWFSAVEGEVYAMASLFTAVIFWAILRWDEEMMDIQYGRWDGRSHSPDRWIILIMFLLGLAIGVHLLGILVIPAITFVIYFRYSENVTLKGIFLTGLLSVVILGFIQEGVIPGTISIASKFEVGFVTALGLPFFSGSIFFFLMLIAGCVFGLRYARKKGKRVTYTAFMGLVVLLIGYGSFAVIVIRSNANTPLDENNPENLVTLHSYLKREQYGSAPLLTGPYWNSKPNSGDEWGDLSPVHLRRFVVKKGDKVIKAFIDENRALAYSEKSSGTTVEETYFESNDKSRLNRVPTYSQTTVFPRMYWSAEPTKVGLYKSWSGYDANDGTATDKGSDGKRLPSMGENLTYFGSYQVGWMYWRYFMWNFAGRQNDIQGHGTSTRGNWVSGFSFIDDDRLGDISENAPYFTAQNPSYNKLFFLPLIFGLIGLIFHFYKAPKDAFVLLLAFIFTGLAIVLYLNQKPLEPRERDYAYAGSFYFFAMWIGIGVYALYEAFRSFTIKEYKSVGIIAGAGLLLTAAMDIGQEASMPTALSWIMICVIGGGLIFAMVGLRKVLKESQGAIVAGVLGLMVPVLMGMQGWDDHDRSLKTSAHDLASNYLESCGQNGILFTNGDNDTFPLWYMQEVEGERTDVRVCNLSLMQTDWYTDQMKLKAYDSDPLPIKFTEDQILMDYGNTDQVYFVDLFGLFTNGANQDLIKKVITLRAKANPEELKTAVVELNTAASLAIGSAKANDAESSKKLNYSRSLFSATKTGSSVDDIYGKYEAVMYIFGAFKSQKVQLAEQNLKALQDAIMKFESRWSHVDLAEAMAFVRDDNNLWANKNISGKVRIFPSSDFKIPVNIENAYNSGVITKEQKSKCTNEIRVQFGARGLTREEVMMLDIIGNNDWKRGVYFSSPGGSDVAKTLYQSKCIRQNGMAFELSPLAVDPKTEMFGGYRFNADKMYDNLMNKYSYGAMNNPDVLTDYYARRHTNQYRMHFLALAEYFVNMTVVDPDNQKQYKAKAKALMHRSTEVMPADIVIDHGEPSPGQRKYRLGEGEITSYEDGILHDYVRILYMAGDIEGAEELGDVVAGQLESILNHFDKSDIRVIGKGNNLHHMYAAMDAYYKLYIAASDPSSNPNGELSKRTLAKLDYYNQKMYKRMVEELETHAKESGEVVRRSSKMGRYTTMMYQIIDYAEAMAAEYGMMEQPAAPPTTGGGELEMPLPTDTLGE